MEVHPDFGELYPFSDYKRGDVITFRVEHGKELTGEVIWVSHGGPLPSGGSIGPHYWAVPEEEGFPRCVKFGDVVIQS